MAVYTQVSAEEMGVLLARYDVGTLVSFKGIAEGVENSNYLVDTSAGRFILTLYEKRVDVGDLPFFLTLLDHLADERCVEPLRQALNDPSPHVRRNAVHSLGCQRCKLAPLPMDVVGLLIERSIGNVVRKALMVSKTKARKKRSSRFIVIRSLKHSLFD